MKKKYIIPNSSVYVVSPHLMEDTGLSMPTNNNSADPQVEDVGDILGKEDDMGDTGFPMWED